MVTDASIVMDRVSRLQDKIAFNEDMLALFSSAVELIINSYVEFVGEALYVTQSVAEFFFALGLSLDPAETYEEGLYVQCCCIPHNAHRW